jgi:hypothetical protein
VRAERRGLREDSPGAGLLNAITSIGTCYSTIMNGKWNLIEDSALYEDFLKYWKANKGKYEDEEKYDLIGEDITVG